MQNKKQKNGNEMENKTEQIRAKIADEREKTNK